MSSASASELFRVAETISLCKRVANAIRKCYNCTPEDIHLGSVIVKLGLRERKLSEMNVISKPLAAVDFSKFHICCAYMVTYAAVHVELNYIAMNNLFHAYGDLKTAATPKDKLTITSIGGGPGNDLLGAMYMLKERYPQLRALDLHIVDTEIRWQMFFSTMMSEIKSNGECNELCKFINGIDLSHSFLNCDATNLNDGKFDKLRSVLLNSDLILMVKTLSMLTLEKKQRLVKAVLYLMKKDSILLIVDSESPSFIAMKTEENFEVILDIKDIVACTKSTCVYNCENISVCVADAIALKKK